MATPLRTLREQIGVTQEQLARDLDVAVVTISAWERKQKRPLKPYVTMLAEYFDVPIDELDLAPNRMGLRKQRQHALKATQP